MKIDICGCGTNHDAHDAALRMIRQSIRYHAHGENDRSSCILWLSAVTAAFNTVMSQTVGLALDEVLAEDPKLDEDRTELVLKQIAAAEGRAVLAYHNDPHYAKELSDYVCDECGIPLSPERRALVASGPAPSTVNMAKQAAGVVEPSNTPFLDALRALLPELAIPPGSKTH